MQQVLHIKITVRSNVGKFAKRLIALFYDSVFACAGKMHSTSLRGENCMGMMGKKTATISPVNYLVVPAQKRFPLCNFQR